MHVCGVLRQTLWKDSVTAGKGKGMYLFDLQTVLESAQKTAVPSHQMK